MAHAPILQDRTVRRATKAAGIVTRQEVIPCDDRAGYYSVTDTGTGSGNTYFASATSCSCPDAQFRGNRCKHQIAVAAEELALAEYASIWSSMVEQARAAVDQPCTGQTVPLSTNEYAGPYGSDGWPAPRPTCSDCGAELESRQFYVGGRGYLYFQVCTADAEHQALPA